ncbi:MAG: AzlD domain-containing protein [Chloroflexota bacterium]|nr:AzlD domain-containing protein [Chloroflexota bacterium]
MNGAWLTVIAVGVGTIFLKGVGPVVLGGRSLPPRLGSVVAMLAPALLAALVATAAVASGQRLVADARLIGLGVAALGITLRAPVLAVVLAAAVSAAIARLLGAP